MTTLDRPEPPFPEQHQSKPGLEHEMSPRPQFEASAYREADKLLGLTALITGGDSGIGRAVALLYAREGANIAIVFLPSEQSDAEETAMSVKSTGRECLLLPGDITDPAFCEDAVEDTVAMFGRLDILVNNAAFQQHQSSIEELSFAQWQQTFQTNIHGYFLMAKAALKHLKRGGVILNTGSVTGIEGSEELLDYSSTKGAIHTFTKSLASSLLSRGIRVNCVAPGPVWTPLNVADKPAEDAALHGSDVPMRRPAQPDEISPAFVFLASNADSSYITGEVLTLLGGKMHGS
ncbi:MAG: SDR family oxidoreductase [Gemmatimonadaceae bacterium]|nr:SDR family oxidoreductase [Gemmatimonadaceae bacterium]